MSCKKDLHEAVALLAKARNMIAEILDQNQRMIGLLRHGENCPAGLIHRAYNPVCDCGYDDMIKELKASEEQPCTDT
jgi:hypothetical protein